MGFIRLHDTIDKNYPAVITRSSETHHEMVLGIRGGVKVWNIFADATINNGTGTMWPVQNTTYVPLQAPSLLTLVSTSTDDTLLGTGARSMRVEYVDATRSARSVDVEMDGTTPVAIGTGYGINYMDLLSAGSAMANQGTITASATSDSSVQSVITQGKSGSHQCIFHTHVDHKALVEFVSINVNKLLGSSPVITVVGKVYNYEKNVRKEIFRQVIDTSVENDVEVSSYPFLIPEYSTFWVDVTSNTDATLVAMRCVVLDLEDGFNT